MFLVASVGNVEEVLLPKILLSVLCAKKFGVEEVLLQKKRKILCPGIGALCSNSRHCGRGSAHCGRGS